MRYLVGQGQGGHRIPDSHDGRKLPCRDTLHARQRQDRSHHHAVIAAVQCAHRGMYCFSVLLCVYVCTMP